VRGNFGTQQFSFASGTSQENIVVAILTFQDETGVTAAISDQNPARVAFTSLEVGSAAYVRVSYSGYLWNLFSCCPFGTVSTNDLADRGSDHLTGDVNCDRHVNGIDVAMVLQAWGTCQKPPVACPADVDWNGIVDVDDLLLVLQ